MKAVCMNIIPWFAVNFGINYICYAFTFLNALVQFNSNCTANRGITYTN